MVVYVSTRNRLREDHVEKNVLVAVAEGSEELETVCIVDVLRRAGANTTLASVGELGVNGSKGIKLIADRLLTVCLKETYDLIALPGGMPGSEHLRDCASLSRRSSDSVWRGVYTQPSVPPLLWSSIRMACLKDDGPPATRTSCICSQT